MNIHLQNVFNYGLQDGHLGHTGSTSAPKPCGTIGGGIHSLSHPAFGLVKFISVKENLCSYKAVTIKDVICDPA